MAPKDRTSLKELSRLLRSKQLTLAVAESCTAGLLQNSFSLCFMATEFFQGELTVYNISQKAKHLGVDPILALPRNAVSKEVAQTMALNVSKLFNASLGLSITGYAEPIPQKGISTCHAYIALSSSKELLWCKRLTGNSEKTLEENQKLYLSKTIKQLLTYLRARE